MTPTSASELLPRFRRRWSLEAKIAQRIQDELGFFHFVQPTPRVTSTSATLRACGLEPLPPRATPAEHALELERVTHRLEAWMPFDPWFVAFARDPYGDSYGFFCYPPALEKGLGAPVVRFDHELRALVWVAEDWARFAARRAQSQSAPKQAFQRLLSFSLPPRWRAALAGERMASGVAVDAERPVGRSKADAFERAVTLAESWQWSEPLISRADAQLRGVQKELAFERRAHPIRLRSWLRHPDVFERELTTMRAPPDER